MEAETFEVLNEVALEAEAGPKKKILAAMERLSPTLTLEQTQMVREIEDAWADTVGSVQAATAGWFLDSMKAPPGSDGLGTDTLIYETGTSHPVHA